MARFAFFPGCLIPVKYPQMEKAVRLTLPKLGIDLVDLQGLTCCPDPIHFKAYDKMGWLTIAARNLCIAEEAGLDFMTICSGCTSTLSEAYHLLMEDEDLKERVNKRLKRIGKEYRGESSVRHIITLLKDEVGTSAVRDSVKRPLEDLRVAIHYGCHLLKPSRIMNVDDPDYPELMESLIDATGATPVRHREWILCCGKACFDEVIPKEMMRDILASVLEMNAHCMGVICPSCFSEFDLGQIILSRHFKTEFGIPVLYYFQILALAQGFPPEEVGLERHRIKARAVIEAIPA